MRIFLYEFLTSGGCGEDPEESLLREGLAMATALADDLLRLRGISVEITAHRNLAPRLAPLTDLPGLTIHWVDTNTLRQTITRLFDECQAAFVVAPEFSGHLSEITRLATERGTRLLSVDLDLVTLFSDKQKTNQWLRDHNVPVPVGYLVDPQASLDKTGLPAFPAVLKPNDGAGSQGVELVESLALFPATARSQTSPFWLEAYIPGQPASVSILGTGHGYQILAPCLQRLANNSFEYLGGCVLADGPLRDRCLAIANDIARQLPPFRGYIGIDIVLGDDARDYAIEVNPRVTTSYVGLRASTNQNLANGFLGLRSEQDLRFDVRPLEFRADGTLVPDSH